MLYPVEGNEKRIEWIETMLELSMDVSISYLKSKNLSFEIQMRLKLYERAIYGLLCGRIEAVTPVCKTYADYLWAYTSCYIEQEVHSILVYVIERKLFHLSIILIFRSTHGSEGDKPLHRLQMTTIFDEIVAVCPTHIRDEASLPFNQIEKYLILADFDRLFQSILSYLHGEESNGSLLRFSTHVCLFLYEQNHSEQFHEKTLLDILTTYIHHLIELEFKDLVCYYISKLPTTQQCKMK